jgi:hypothetical protein
MSFLRWAPTLLGFPVGGWLAFQIAGSITGPLTAALAGVIAGAVIGGAQWLALGRVAGWRWLAATVLGIAAGSSLAAAATGAGTTTPALVISGLVTGAVVSAEQGVGLHRGLRVTAVWTATVSMGWALSWLVTANVIVDAENGYVAFGAPAARPDGHGCYRLGAATYSRPRSPASSHGHRLRSGSCIRETGPVNATVAAAVLLILLAVAFNVAFAALAAKFDYPDILRRPTTEVLDRFRQGGSGLVLLW